MAILYLNSETHVIKDDKGKAVSVDEAKQLYQNGQVEDCSQSFLRFANFGFDFEKLDQFYRDNP